MPPKELESAVRAARPRRKPYKLACGGSLYLLINPNGSRWWRFRYRFQGREKLLSLGIYPDVTTAAAVTARDRIKAQLQNGVDPSEVRRNERIKREPSTRAPEFRLSISDSGALTISTARQSIRLTTSQTEAVRAFLRAEPESQNHSGGRDGAD